MRTAFSFLTVLPVGRLRVGPDDSLGRAWFPLVGLVLGILGAAAGWGVRLVSVPALGALVTVGVLVLLTGALHLDGLADSADGLFGGADRDRRLAIMRDPRVGVFGAAALILVLLGDVLALTALRPLEAALAVVSAAALARFAMLCCVVALPYVRSSGLGVAAARGRAVRDVAVGVPFAALPLIWDWRHGLLAVGLVLVSTLAVALFARHRIGGATGDVYGAVVEVGQLAAVTAFTVRL